MSNLAYLLVGDHLGQVKKVFISSGDARLLEDCATPSKDNPVVSIEKIPKQNKFLIANKGGQLYIHDAGLDVNKCSPKSGDQDLVKAMPISKKDAILVYENRMDLLSGGDRLVRVKRGQIKTSKTNERNIAYAGCDIPLKVIDIDSKKTTYDAQPPEPNWLGIRPDVYVSDLEFVGGGTRLATCSRSDSVIRVYDIRSKTEPIIQVNMDQVAFNEHADSARFHSISAPDPSSNSLVVGSNVGQVIAIDLRFHKYKQGLPKGRRKKLQPKLYKVVGGFKGAQGCTIKDVKIIPWKRSSAIGGDNMETHSSSQNGESDDSADEATEDSESPSYKVISCGLDRYLRIHDYSQRVRTLDKSIYLKTKPFCCSPVFYST